MSCDEMWRSVANVRSRSERICRVLLAFLARAYVLMGGGVLILLMISESLLFACMQQSLN